MSFMAPYLINEQSASCLDAKFRKAYSGKQQALLFIDCCRDGVFLEADSEAHESFKLDLGLLQKKSPVTDTRT